MRKTWVEIKDEVRGTYNATSKIKFKTAMLKSILRNFSDLYILVKRAILVPNMGTI